MQLSSNARYHAQYLKVFALQSMAKVSPRDYPLIANPRIANYIDECPPAVECWNLLRCPPRYFVDWVVIFAFVMFQ
jgi:hypothetical protein